MKLSDIGEREIVKKILSLAGDENIGDDSAYIPIDGDYLLLSTDVTRKKTHFPDIMTAYDIGYFVASVNLSDIAAMGGKPVGILLSISLPREVDEDFVLSIIRGSKDCVERFGGRLLGGDTKEHNEVTISGTSVGFVPKDEILLRKGAKPGDIVAVTGKLGRAAAGYLAIKHDIKGIPLDGLIRPIPRIVEGRYLAKNRIPTSCMDISDGLSTSLHQISEINRVGFMIFKEMIPVSNEVKKISEILNKDPVDVAIGFGGDYELLLTLPGEMIEDVKKEMEISEIGRVIRDRKINMVYNGEEKPIENVGWENFKF